MIDFLRDLRTRKLVQWGLTYAAFAWLTLQVVDVLAGSWDWPAVVMRVIQVVLAIGLLAALVLAWYHGERGIQRVTATELVLLVGLLIAAGGAVGVVVAEPEGTAADARPPVASGRPVVAVLPFGSISPGSDDSFLAAGMHEQVISQLSKVTGLDVIARTSVMPYETMATRVRDIVGDLGVSHVLEGTVRTAGTRIRFSAVLVEGRSETPVWSQDFDRRMTLEALFEIQDELARRVAGATSAVLLPRDTEELAIRPTDDLEAYELFLQANEYRHEGLDDAFGDVGAAVRSLRIAIDLYEQALVSDPSFALAMAMLGRTHVHLYWVGRDRSPARQRAAREAADRAVAMDRGLGAARVTLGQYLYQVEGDYDGALRELDHAIELSPGDPDAWEWKGWVLRRRGDLEAAAFAMEKALSVNPRNTPLADGLCSAYELMERLADARRTCGQVLRFNPDHLNALRKLASIELWDGGGVGAARAVLTSTTVPGADRIFADVAYWLSLYESDPEGALRALEAFPDDHVFTNVNDLTPVQMLRGYAHRLRGDSAAARPHLETARRILETGRKEGEGDFRLHQALAVVHALLGDEDRASVESALSYAAHEGAEDVLRAPYADLHHAWAMAALGRTGEAVAALRRLMVSTSVARQRAGPLHLDPRWAPLHGDPAFEELAARPPH